jgi:hypothetical protein
MKNFFSFNWIAQEENLSLLYDLTENDTAPRITAMIPLTPENCKLITKLAALIDTRRTCQPSVGCWQMRSTHPLRGVCSRPGLHVCE